MNTQIKTPYLRNLSLTIQFPIHIKIKIFLNALTTGSSDIVKCKEDRHILISKKGYRVVGTSRIVSDSSLYKILSVYKTESRPSESTTFLTFLEHQNFFQRLYD